MENKKVNIIQDIVNIDSVLLELEEQLKMTCSKNEQLESILRQTRTKTIHLEEAKTKLNWENEQLKEALVYQSKEHFKYISYVIAVKR